MAECCFEQHAIVTIRTITRTGKNSLFHEILKVEAQSCSPVDMLRVLSPFCRAVRTRDPSTIESNDCVGVIADEQLVDQRPE